MTMDAWTFWLPEIVMVAGACALLLLGVSPLARMRSGLAGATVVVLGLALCATMVAGIPEPAAVGPGLLLTPLACFVRWATLTVGLVLLLLNWNQGETQERGEYFSLFLFALSGVMLTAAASDLVVLFLAIELVSVPTYVLVALSRRDARASEATVKYFFLGALSAAVLAYGLSFLYGASGGTSLRTLSRVTLGGAGSSAGNVTALIGLVLSFAGLSFKIAAVPFHAYVADVYEGAASPVTALLGFVPKLAGFTALIKLFDAFGWDLPGGLLWLIWGVAALTMTVGNVLALLQKSMKRMLAYSSVAHSGYMLVALLVGPAMGQGPMSNGIVALMFYMIVYGVMNLGAFAALCCLRVGDRPVETVEELSGLARVQPWSAVALGLCIFSLMGLPPTAGFLGKLYIFSGAFSLTDGHVFRIPLVVLAVIGVVNAAIGAAYYLRIVASCYLNRPRAALAPVETTTERMGLVIAGVAMLALFFVPEVFLSKARLAAYSDRASARHVAMAPRADGAEVASEAPAARVASGLAAGR